MRVQKRLAAPDWQELPSDEQILEVPTLAGSQTVRLNQDCHISWNGLLSIWHLEQWCLANRPLTFVRWGSRLRRESS